MVLLFWKTELYSTRIFVRRERRRGKKKLTFIEQIISNCHSVWMCSAMDNYTWNVHRCLHTYVRMYCISVFVNTVHVHTYVHMYVHMYVCVHNCFSRLVLPAGWCPCSSLSSGEVEWPSTQRKLCTRGPSSSWLCRVPAGYSHRVWRGSVYGPRSW